MKTAVNWPLILKLTVGVNFALYTAIIQQHHVS